MEKMREVFFLWRKSWNTSFDLDLQGQGRILIDGKGLLVERTG